MDCSTPGFPVIDHLPKFAPIHVRGVHTFQMRIKAIMEIKLKILMKAVYSGNQVTGSPDHI